MVNWQHVENVLKDLSMTEFNVANECPTGNSLTRKNQPLPEITFRNQNHSKAFFKCVIH